MSMSFRPSLEIITNIVINVCIFSLKCMFKPSATDLKNGQKPSNNDNQIELLIVILFVRA
jgi:hypothetical protein